LTSRPAVTAGAGCVFFLKKKFIFTAKGRQALVSAYQSGLGCLFLNFFFYIFFCLTVHFFRREGPAGSQLVLFEDPIFFKSSYFFGVGLIALVFFFFLFFGTCKFQGLGSSHGWGDFPKFSFGFW
jgi:hypothetical protein